MNDRITRADFARILGVSRAYVSQLGAEGRLVLSQDGALVDVPASLERMKYLADPSKQGVRARWAAFREGRALPEIVEEPAAVALAAPAPTNDPAKGNDSDGARFQQARARRELAEAQMAEIELKKIVGALADAPSVVKAVMDAHLSARNEILSLADRISTQVCAESDPRKVHDMVSGECERICERIARGAEQAATMMVGVPA